MSSHKEIKPIRGHHYLYEIESAWDKKRKQSRKVRSVYLGACDAKGNLLAQPKVQLDGVHSAFPVGPLSVFYAQAKALRLAETAEEVLGLKPGLASLLLAMVLNQLTGRVSRREIPLWIERSPLRRWEPSLPSELTPHHVDAVMDALCRPLRGGGYRNQGLLLQTRLTREGPREEPGAFYDVTKVPYSGTHCPVAQYGINSDKEISRVVGFGLVLSRERHRPMLCSLLPGSRNDMITVEGTLAMLKELEKTVGRKLEGIPLSMDRGMVSASNLERVVRAGFHQVGMVKDWPKGAWECAGRWPGETLERPEHALCRVGGDPLYGRAFTEILYGRPLRLVLMENPERKAEERRTRDIALQQWSGRLNDEKRRELTKELQGVLVEARGRRGWSVDPGKVAEERVRDGRFLLFSTNLKMETREVFDLWTEREVIEEMFRTVKGDLTLAPLRYRQVDRLEAYSTVVYLAMLLWSEAAWLLRQKFPEEPLGRALHALGDVYWVRLGSKKIIRDWTTTLSDKQKDILDSLRGLPYLPRP